MSADMGAQTGRWAEAVRGLTRMLVVPQGFTLSIAGSLAATIGHREMADLLEVWMFVLGGGVGFCLLVLGTGAHVTRMTGAPPPSGAALLNVVPLAVVPGAVLGSGWIPNLAVGYLVAGLLASSLYVVLLAAVSAMAARFRTAGRARSDEEEGRPREFS